MSAVTSPLALATFAGLALTPPRERARENMPDRSLVALGKLEPIEDDKVALPEPCLVLDAADLAVVQAKAAALSAARAELDAADQALARAQTLARRVPRLREAAGVAAAAAFSGRKLDAQDARRASADLDEAEHAAHACPALLEQQRVAKDRVAEAFGTLRANAQRATRNALVRQGREYQRLAAELVRVVGHMQAGIELLNDADLCSTVNCLFTPRLSLPAPPPGLISDHGAVCELHFAKMLLKAEHPALLANATSARTRLVAQLEGATGMPAQRLLL